jgi:hypothetical protein
VSDADRVPVVSEIGPWAMVPIWVLSVGLNGAELAVYVALRSFADVHRTCYPKVRTIAARAGVSERTAERAIASLRAKSLIRTERIMAGPVITGCRYWIRDIPPHPTDRNDATPGATQSPPPTDADVATPPAQMSPGSRRGCRNKEQTNEQTTQQTKKRKTPGADKPRGADDTDSAAADLKNLIKSITDAWWEAHPEATAQKYIAGRTAIEQALANGMDHKLLHDLAVEVAHSRKPLSAGTIGFALSRRRDAETPDYTASDADEEYHRDAYSE